MKEHDKIERKYSTDKEIVYHEAGHAVLAALYSDIFHLESVTIVPYETEMEKVEGYADITLLARLDDPEVNSTYLMQLLAGFVSEKLLVNPRLRWAELFFQRDLSSALSFAKQWSFFSSGNSYRAAAGYIWHLQKEVVRIRFSREMRKFRKENIPSDVFMEILRRKLSRFSLKRLMDELYALVEKDWLFLSPEEVRQAGDKVISLLSKTIKIVKEHQKEISAVAEELLKKKTLSGKEVEKIVESINNKGAL